MNPLGEVRRGIFLGKSARQFFTELRENFIDPWETENLDSPYYDKAEPFRGEYSLFEYVGIIIGQLMHPREWYINAEYLFGD